MYAPSKGTGLTRLSNLSNWEIFDEETGNSTGRMWYCGFDSGGWLRQREPGGGFTGVGAL
jgi:hypothetical protein